MAQIQKRHGLQTESETSPKKFKIDEILNQKITSIDNTSTKTSNQTLKIIPILINHKIHSKSLNNNPENVSRHSNLIYLIGNPENEPNTLKNNLDLSETDLQVLLQNFYKLDGEEQQRLITHMKKLETSKPDLVDKLSKFVRVSSPVQDESDDLDDLDDILNESMNILIDSELVNVDKTLDNHNKNVEGNIVNKTVTEEMKENLARKIVNNKVWKKPLGNIKKKIINKERRIVSYDDLQVFYPTKNICDNQKISTKNVTKSSRLEDSTKNNSNDIKVDVQEETATKTVVKEEIIVENTELIKEEILIVKQIPKIETKTEIIALITAQESQNEKPKININLIKDNKVEKEPQTIEVKSEIIDLTEVEESHVDKSQEIRIDKISFKQENSGPAVKEKQIPTANSSSSELESKNVSVNDLKKQQETNCVNKINNLPNAKSTGQEKVVNSKRRKTFCHNQNFNQTFSNQRLRNRFRNFGNNHYNTPQEYYHRTYFRMDPSYMSPEMQAQYFDYQNYIEMRQYREMTGIYYDQNSYYSYADRY